MDNAAPETVRPIEQPQYLTFGIADDEYAVDILQVREIMQFPKVTHLPQTPPWIRGVMNLRGAVVPVIDLGAKFGLGPSSATRTTCVIVLEIMLCGEATVMAIMTDKVNKVVELGASDMEPPPAFGTRVRPDFLLGIASLGEKLACILDIDRVLSVDEILAAKAATGPAEESKTADVATESGPNQSVMDAANGGRPRSSRQRRTKKDISGTQRG